MFSRSLLILALSSMTAFATQNSNEFELPYTADSGSVQAILKKTLFSALLQQDEKSAEFPYKAHFSGDYRRVVLEDSHSKIVCQEGPPDGGGFVPQVQLFKCTFENKN